MKALAFAGLASLALLGGCASDGYYGGGGSYYSGDYYGNAYYGPDYYAPAYGYAYIPRGGYGGGYRGHDGGRQYGNRGGQYRGERGNWNDTSRGNRENNSQAMRDADRAAHPGNYNAGGERITRGNFWRQNQSMGQTQQQAAPSPPSGDQTGSRGFRGRRGN